MSDPGAPPSGLGPARPSSGLLRQARRVVVAVIGGTLLIVGIAMLILPGPAVVVIPAGLALLATEFVWARRLLRRVRERVGLRPPPQ